MSLTGSERETIAYYDQTAEDWNRKHGQGVSIWANELERFKHFVPGGHILEIGSGAGKEAESFIRDNYEYTSVDPSIDLLNIARDRNPSGRFVIATASDLPFAKRRFDGFWAAASLLHVPKAKIDDSLKNIYRVLYPAAYGFISLKEGEGEKKDEGGRTFSYYFQEKFAQILDDNNFNVLRSVAREERTFTWIMYYVQRR